MRVEQVAIEMAVMKMKMLRLLLVTGALVVFLASCASFRSPSSDGDVPQGTAAPVAADGEAPPHNPLLPYPPVRVDAGVAAAAKATTDVPVWRHYPLPGKQATQYRYVQLDKRHSIAAKAVSSASMLRQPLRVDASKLRKLGFSWKVPKLIAGADLTRREAHDSPVRVVLVFEGDRSRFSMKNAMMSELARTLTGEELPYATLMYVWCNACEPGAVLVNPRTDRIREIALESGPTRLNRWLDYQRNIVEDYQKAFGEPPGALLDVGIMTDTDNTKQSTVAWYGPISLFD